jgi:hypothetical protein
MEITDQAICQHRATRIERVGPGLTAQVCNDCERVVRQLESETKHARRVQMATDLKRLLASGRLNAWERGSATALLGLKKFGPSQFRTIERMKQLHLGEVLTQNENQTQNKNDAREGF